MNEATLPAVGGYYHFWDDGKTAPERHYIVRIESIILPVEAMGTLVAVPNIISGNRFVYGTRILYEVWKENISNGPNLYGIKTDYFIEISCPGHSSHNLWCVQSTGSHWFSMNVQNSFQTGILDVDGTIFMEVSKDRPYYYVEATKENYERQNWMGRDILQ